MRPWHPPDLTASTDPPDRSLFGRGGFPGTVKLSRKARGAEGEGQQQGDAELQRGVAALALGERPGSGGRRQMVSGCTCCRRATLLGLIPAVCNLMSLQTDNRLVHSQEAVSSSSPPPPKQQQQAPSLGVSGGSSRSGSSQDEAAADAGQQQNVQPEREGVQVAMLRSMSNTRIAKFNRLLGEQVRNLACMPHAGLLALPLRRCCLR